MPYQCLQRAGFEAVRSVLLTVRLCEECLLEACLGSEPPGGACTPGQDGEPWCGPWWGRGYRSASLVLLSSPA